MVSHGFEEIDHTADLALHVWGEDFHALLQQAAQGMYQLMDISTHHGTQTKIEFQIADESWESVLVDFLSELLYLAEDKQIVFDDFSFSEDEQKVRVEATGERISEIRRNIKAVTFHNLEVTQTKSGLETTITFDV